MNTKKDKIELLRAIAEGEIDPKTLSPESVIVSDGKTAFDGLMISVANKKAGKRNPVVYVGEARKSVLQIVENIKTGRTERELERNS
tara:strand:+ start:1012 stop:1272 length:261 start_codon:yes stop_codon:yes gene_type:complete